MSSATDAAFHGGLALIGYAHGGLFWAGLMLTTSAFAAALLASGGNDE